jgi:hypothetical protein
MDFTVSFYSDSEGPPSRHFAIDADGVVDAMRDPDIVDAIVRFSCERSAPEDSAAAAAAARIWVALGDKLNLHRYEFLHCPFDDEMLHDILLATGGRLLAGGHGVESLVVSFLDGHSFRLTDHGMGHLCRIPFLAGLRKLALRNCGLRLGQDFFSFLRDPRTQLRELDLKWSTVCVPSLLRALKLGTVPLSKLDLSNCRLTEDDLTCLKKLEKYSDITDLDIDHNDFYGFADCAAETIAALFANKKLVRLGISCGFEHLPSFDTLVGPAVRANTSLTWLDVQGLNLPATETIFSNLGKDSRITSLGVGYMFDGHGYLYDGLLPDAMLAGCPLVDLFGIWYGDDSNIKHHKRLDALVRLRKHELPTWRSAFCALVFCWKELRLQLRAVGDVERVGLDDIPKDLLHSFLPKPSFSTLLADQEAANEGQPPLKRARA